MLRVVPRSEVGLRVRVVPFVVVGIAGRSFQGEGFDVASGFRRCLRPYLVPLQQGQSVITATYFHDFGSRGQRRLGV